MSTITPEPTYKVWTGQKTWSEPKQRLEQDVVPRAFGAPTEPAHAGRIAVDELSDDLRRLADS